MLFIHLLKFIAIDHTQISCKIYNTASTESNLKKLTLIIVIKPFER